MNIETINESTKYRTSDGREFGTEATAVNWQHALNAQQDVRHAVNALAQALANVEKTADGQPLDFGATFYGRVYYYIEPNYYRLPALGEVRLSSLRDMNINECGNLEATCYIGTTPKQFAVSQLYASKRAAEIALLEQMQERVASYQEALNALEAKVNQSGGRNE